jgi:hypothetical protein
MGTSHLPPDSSQNKILEEQERKLLDFLGNAQQIIELAESVHKSLMLIPLDLFEKVTRYFLMDTVMDASVQDLRILKARDSLKFIIKDVIRRREICEECLSGIMRPSKVRNEVIYTCSKCNKSQSSSS